MHALALALVLAAAAPAVATTAQDLCGFPLQNPCVITTPRAIDDGSILNFGVGDLILRTSGGRLDVGAGTMVLIAGNVTLETGARLQGAGGTIKLVAFYTLSLQAGARIDASADAGGGTVDLRVLGDVVAAGDLLASGTSAVGIGGWVHVDADGNVTLGDLAARGGGQVFPPFIVPQTRGAVAISAGGALTVGDVDVSHGDCFACGIDFTAGGDLHTGKLNAKATGPVGDGGTVSLDADGSVFVDADVLLQGGGGDGESGGSGGDITVEADGDLRLAGSLLLGGTSPDGDGGSFDLSAGGDFVQLSSSVIDADGGNTGCGGSPTSVFAGRDLTLGVVKLNGGSCDAGELDAEAGRDLTVVGTVSANADSDGVGGDVSVLANRNLVVDATIRANGGAAGTGGDISLEGCDLTVTANAQILSLGPEGTIALAAHDHLAVYGTVQAGESNRLAFGDPARPPVITGPVTPLTLPIVDSALLPCVLGASCGDGTVTPPEECDDGNTDPCDGCSPGCRDEACGNGRLDCGEECDPPDAALCGPDCHVRQTIVQRLPGGSVRHGCQVEWEVANANGTLTHTGMPTRAQSCDDGDPACDADGASDGACRFHARICLRVDDPRLPECSPAALAYVSVRAPRPLSPGDATEAANATVLVDALRALGITVRAGSTELFPGTPETGTDRCTAPFLLDVPHGGNKGRRRFTIGSADVAGHRLASNSIKLDCLPNDAVCGDGVLDAGEECEDGNTLACDGCSPSCHLEACGNGVVDCHEDCDDGPWNGAPGSRCSVQCREPMPALRIPGGGGRTIDCALEWSAALDPATVDTDSHSLPRNRQVCVDGDPACDFDTTAGTCRFHLFVCLAGGDARLGCPPLAVSSVDLLRPAVGDPTRAGFVDALQAIGFPAGPGEECSQHVAVDVPVGRQLRAKTRTRLASGKTDSDNLKLKCLAAP